MAETHTKVREVAWSELFPWLMLLRTVRISLMARVLVLGAAGLSATAVGWHFLIMPFANNTDPVIATWKQNTNLMFWGNGAKPEVEPFWVNTSAHSAEEIFESAHVWLVRAPVKIWTYFTRPFVAMFEAKSPTGFLFYTCEAWLRETADTSRKS